MSTLQGRVADLMEQRGRAGVGKAAHSLRKLVGPAFKAAMNPLKDYEAIFLGTAHRNKGSNGQFERLHGDEHDEDFDEQVAQGKAELEIPDSAVMAVLADLKEKFSFQASHLAASGPGALASVMSMLTMRRGDKSARAQHQHQLEFVQGLVSLMDDYLVQAEADPDSLLIPDLVYVGIRADEGSAPASPRRFLLDVIGILDGKRIVGAEETELV